MCVSVKLTVFFEQPFWVGVFERTEDNLLCVNKVVFGSEPKDYEVYNFLLREYFNLKYSGSIFTDELNQRKINPKRQQREIKKNIENSGVGTKAQIAIQLQHEVRKVERRSKSKEEKEIEKDKQFELRQQRKKEKRKGH